MKVCVVGVGYIGLPTAALLASHGHKVVGVDINIDYIIELNNRSFYTEEKDLLALISMGMDNKSLSFKESPENADVFIICTPTPLKDDNTPDLSSLINALENVLKYAINNNIIIIESTIPPSTINKVVKPLIESYGFVVGLDIYLAYCPERVLPNNIVYELINNPRIIGGCTEICAEKAEMFYKTFVKGEIYQDNVEIVEMVKLVENSSRDVNIAFSNELAILCSDLGIDPFRVIELANKHPRVNILMPGIGVGGHCLPVDGYFLINNNPSLTTLISLSRAINNNMPSFIGRVILNILEEFTNPCISLWGVSYKGDSSDIRNSPAMEILNILLANNINVKVYDPVVYKHDLNHAIDTLRGSNLLLILVNHNNFYDFDYNKYIPLMKNQILFDCSQVTSNISLDKNIKIFKLFIED